MEKLDLKEKLNSPLADRFRPQNLDEFLGQEHILAKGKLLRKAIENEQFYSFILWGPPGCGKTTLARIISQAKNYFYKEYSAVVSGINEIKQTIKEALLKEEVYHKKTILFIDEIHRFNKSQQDAFLPYIEKGLIVLIGATTENPYFEITPPLSSRLKIYEMKPLPKKDLAALINKVILDQEQGLGKEKINFETEEAFQFILDSCNGDARKLLNTLEHIVLGNSHKKEIDLEIIKDALQKKPILYDQKGDYHYETISAFIKSIRGGDPDAALYYLARMLYAGEDPRFIARRMIIAASEDIGNADPLAILVANSAMQSVEFIGMPEARIILAQACIYLACAPKSNAAYLGIEKALNDVKNKANFPIPLHLRNFILKDAQSSLKHIKYKYPHDYPGNFVSQQYLPDNLVESIYYQPADQGFEIKIKDRLKKRWPKHDVK